MFQPEIWVGVTLVRKNRRSILQSTSDNIGQYISSTQTYMCLEHLLLAGTLMTSSTTISIISTVDGEQIK